MANKYATAFLTTSIGIAGGEILSAYFGFVSNKFFIVLLIVILLDYLTGILSALLKKSNKTKTHKLSSTVMYKGLIKKVLIILLLVAIFYSASVFGFEGDTLFNGACTAFIFNDIVSIIENVSACGVPMPKIITRFIETYKEKDNAEVG